MKLFRKLSEISPPPPYAVATIGNFDGVHLGHQVIIRQILQRAKTNSGTSVVISFDPHPLKVLRGQSCPPLLTTTEQKTAIFSRMGVDWFVCLEFTEAFSRLRPEEFIHQALIDSLQVRELYVGYDFHFGRDRVGTISTLVGLAVSEGVQVTVVPPVKYEDHRVSSSLIRTLITTGKVAEAARFLGRHFSIDGVVVHGEHRGKSIGFPTANVAHRQEAVPAEGVYAGYALLEGRRHQAVINLGRKPTFKGATLTLEAHIFDLVDDIYGRTIEIQFVERLRGEITFDSVEKLVAQIAQDAQHARELLAHHG